MSWGVADSRHLGRLFSLACRVRLDVELMAGPLALVDA